MDYKTAKKYTNFLEKQKNGIPQYFKQNPVSIFAQKSQIQALFSFSVNSCAQTTNYFI